MLEGEDTDGEFNYYIAESATPMEDQVLQCPFDNPQCLADNLRSNSLKGVSCRVFNGRMDAELCSPLSIGGGDEGVEGNHQLQRILDSRGILLTRHASTVRDFWDDDEILNTHYDEMRLLAKSLSGADRTAVAAHALRKQGSVDGPRLSETVPMARDAAFTVHNDFSDLLKDQFISMFEKGVPSVVSTSIDEGGLGIDSVEQLKRGRLSIINFWRPLDALPLRRNPLAVLDATTIGDDDIVLCKHPLKDANYTFLKFYRLPIPFINTLIRPNASHRWFYFPYMTRDEVIVFKNYDSLGPMPKNGVGMHSSFHDPLTPVDAPPRESIEVRVACFWDQ